ncbi:MAG: hypothetical protein Q4G59_12020, partial [Planctomycetia bacterium]|nr:hypothetical protein [Planctomycetia bacterium]
MLNSGKHFLSGLLNRFSSRQGKRSWFSKGSVDHLRARHLSMEPLEDRQLLAVTAAEMASLAGAYSSLGVSATDNFIEIVNEKLSLQELQNAVNLAASTSSDDVIVLRTTTQAFTLDLGNSPLTIDVPTSKGNLCIIGVGEQPLRLTAQSGTVLSIDSGTIGLGNANLVGDQALGTEKPLITTAISAVLSTQDVNFTVQTYWTKSLPNGGDAYITLNNGIYSVDWAVNRTTDYRSYVTGLKTMTQVNDLLGLDYTQADPVYKVDSSYIDADINDTYGVDTKLMWAGSAADLLNYSGWGHIVSSDEDA